MASNTTSSTQRGSFERLHLGIWAARIGRRSHDCLAVGVRGLVVALLLAATAATASAQVVVFAPHPDDEALFASGIVYAALQSGKNVKVVVATNGDCEIPSIGHTRELETIAAMSRLGLPASSVIFLGYPDCGLPTLFFSYTGANSTYTSNAGLHSTYGFEGLGSSDYHRYIYGVSAPYNRPSLIQDIQTVLSNYRPQDVYVTSAYDENPDHNGLNFFVTEALIGRMRQDPTFQPTLHDAIVHEPCELSCNPNYHWPDPPFTPTVPFTAPPFLSQTPLLWSDVQSVPVPAPLAATTMDANLKYQAISQYQSQFSPWLPSFVKSNEIFWKWELWSNLALSATATASSSLSAATSPDRVNNGSVSGLPRREDGEWVSNGQLAGAWSQLTWPTAKQISSVVLHDRPMPNENITGGTLSFSNGTTLAVGALPASGAGLTVSFAAKSVTWVRFTVTSATGSAAGLAEFEVYGLPATKLPWQAPGTNVAPTISSGPFATPSLITDAATASLTVTANDSNGDALTYTWTPAQGTINGSGATVTFVPQTVGAQTTVRIDLAVADGRGGRATGFVNVTVSPSGLPTNVARNATATASSENIDRGQGAAKAIDGVVDGYPAASDKEWVAPGQLAGAWIQLTWPTAQTIGSVTLHDRINTIDHITAGTLQFSNGSSIAVGALPNDGSGLTFPFANKSVTWVRFNITSATGDSTGLAEFEVFTASSAPNTPPQITAGPTATPATLIDTPTSGLSVTASDANGDTLTYSWSATGGTISGTGATVTYTPPHVTVQTVYRVDVVVSDGRGGQATGSVNVTVNPTPVTNTPPQITAGPTATPSTILDTATSSVSVSATDANGDTLTYAWSVNAGTVTGTGASATFTPPRVTVTTAYQVIVQISDGHGGQATGSVNITVNPSNLPPQITVAPAAAPSVILDTATSALSVTATDPNGDALTYTWSATGGTVAGTGRTATYTPPRITAQAIYRVDVQISDGRGGQVTGSVSITVNPSSSSVNVALNATVTASSENASRGQTAVKAIDGVVDGYPTDPTREWVAPGQTAGAWIQLNWTSAQTLYRVILHDRINTDDQILAGTLSFSDGSTVAVATLPNTGVGLTLDFTARSVSWVRFTVTSATPGSTGLAEFEVYNSPATGNNTAPQIVTGPTATPATITDLQTSSLAVSATDADGDPLSYSWQTTGGTLTGTGAGVTFTPPRITTATSYRVTVAVTDGRGGSASGFVDVAVTPTSTSVNVAPLATATASSENTSRGQTAAKAIDTFVDGYPGDSTREWVAPGQLAGAWIQLTWSAARSISSIVLHDRINTDDQILAATLLFSDGSSIAVGTLSNDGAALPVTFTARSVTWVRLNITSARGSNTGLAEIEVY